MADAMREAFEEWAKRKVLGGGEIRLVAWLAWQAALAEQPAQGEAVAWYDGKKFYGSEEAAVCDCADMPNLRAVYYAPPAPAVPALPSDPPPWWAASLNRRAAIEAELFDMASGKRPLPDAVRCRAMALELGVPDEFRARLKYESAPAAPEVPRG